MNKKAIIALTTMLTAANIMPVFAYVIKNDYYTQIANMAMETEKNETVTQTQEMNGKHFTSPGWLEIEGNYYYFEKKTLYDDVAGYYSGSVLFTNGITPDNYLVDEQGRWIENGSVWTNSYGKQKLGMADQYADKSEDEIWAIMKNKLREIWADKYVDMYSKGYSESTSMIKGDVDIDTGSSAYMAANNYLIDAATNQKAFVYLRVPIDWNDWNKVKTIMDSEAMASYATIPATTEKTLKVILGDNAGQQVFDAYRNSVTNNVVNYYIANYNENGIVQEKGKPVVGTPRFKPEDINLELTTDYGRRAVVKGNEITIY